jgi:hypothetical protein
MVHGPPRIAGLGSYGPRGLGRRIRARILRSTGTRLGSDRPRGLGSDWTVHVDWERVGGRSTGGCTQIRWSMHGDWARIGRSTGRDWARIVRSTGSGLGSDGPRLAHRDSWAQIGESTGRAGLGSDGPRRLGLDRTVHRDRARIGRSMGKAGLGSEAGLKSDAPRRLGAWIGRSTEVPPKYSQQYSVSATPTVLQNKYLLRTLSSSKN